MCAQRRASWSGNHCLFFIGFTGQEVVSGTCGWVSKPFTKKGRPLIQREGHIVILQTLSDLQQCNRSLMEGFELKETQPNGLCNPASLTNQGDHYSCCWAHSDLYACIVLYV